MTLTLTFVLNISIKTKLHSLVINVCKNCNSRTRNLLHLKQKMTQNKHLFKLYLSMRSLVPFVGRKLISDICCHLKKKWPFHILTQGEIHVWVWYQAMFCWSPYFSSQAPGKRWFVSEVTLHVNMLKYSYNLIIK